MCNRFVNPNYIWCFSFYKFILKSCVNSFMIFKFSSNDVLFNGMNLLIDLS